MSYTAYPSKIGQLLFAICFSIPSYVLVHQQLHSLDCQKFGHHNSLVFFFTYLGTSPGAGFYVGMGTYNFQIV
jgi:hypothetical protein